MYKRGRRRRGAGVSTGPRGRRMDYFLVPPTRQNCLSAGVVGYGAYSAPPSQGGTLHGKPDYSPRSSSLS